MKWATVRRHDPLSPAFAGLELWCFDPGAYAPGFMLSPASQAYASACYAGLMLLPATQALCFRLLRRLYASACRLRLSL